MKLEAKPPEETGWDRLDRAFRTVITVPKERLLKEEARLKRLKKKRIAQGLSPFSPESVAFEDGRSVERVVSSSPGGGRLPPGARDFRYNRAEWRRDQDWLVFSASIPD